VTIPYELDIQLECVKITKGSLKSTKLTIRFKLQKSHPKSTDLIAGRSKGIKTGRTELVAVALA
jgi:hypothetical protein